MKQTQSRGLLRTFDPDRATPIQQDTFTCSHCDKIVVLHDEQGRALKNVGVHCHGCDRNVCVPCAERAVCRVIEQRCEEMEQRGRLLAAMEA